jgi:hypothetical protein
MNMKNNLMREASRGVSKEIAEYWINNVLPFLSSDKLIEYKRIVR